MSNTVRIPTSNNGVTVRCFHTNTECDVWPDNGRDIPREDADARGLKQCERCEGTNMTGEDNDPHKYIRQIKQARAND